MIIEVEADYSSFYLRRARLARDRARAARTDRPGLIDGDDDQMSFVAFRHHGTLFLDVQILPEEPDSLDETWQDVTGFSLTALEGIELAGWELSVLGTSLPIAAETDLRARYAVSGADRAHPDDSAPYPEKYLLQFWPAALAPATLIRSESAMGEYWNFQPKAMSAKTRALDFPEGERTRAIVEMGFHDHPGSATKIARGDIQFVTGMLAYAQKVFPAEFDHEAVSTMVREIAAEVVAARPDL